MTTLFEGSDARIARALDTKGKGDDLITSIAGIPEDFTTYVNLADNASLRAGDVRGILALLDGTPATTFINTIVTTTSVKATEFAAGGTILPEMPRVMDGIPHVALGGTHAIVGEYGRELVFLPNCAQVTPAGAPESRLEAMGGRRVGGGTAFYGPMTMQIRGDTSMSEISRAAIRRGQGEMRIVSHDVWWRSLDDWSYPKAAFTGVPVLHAPLEQSRSADSELIPWNGSKRQGTRSSPQY